MLTAIIFNALIYLYLFQTLAYFMSKLLIYNKVSARDRIIFYKVYYLITFLMPITFFIFKYYSWHFVTVPAVIIEVISPISVSEVPLTNDQYNYKKLFLLIYFGIFSFLILKIMTNALVLYYQLRSSIEKNFAGISYRLQNIVPSSAFSFGLLKPKSYLNDKLIDINNKKSMKLILMHEKHHCDHYDPLWKLISLIHRSLLFLSPLSYRLHEGFEVELEVYCDEQTLHYSKVTTHTYSETLIRTLENELSNNTLPNYMSNSALQQRIYRMKSRMMKRPWLKYFTCLFCLSTAFTIIAANSTPPSNEPIYRVSSKVFINDEHKGNAFITIQEGLKGEVSMIQNGEETSINVEVTKSTLPINGTPAIMIDFHILNSPNNLDHRAKVVALDGHEATLEFGYADSKPKYTIKLKAEQL